MSGVMVTPNSRSEASAVIFGQARSMVRSLLLGRCMMWLAFKGGRVKVDSDLSLAVEPECLGGPALVTFMVWNSRMLVSNFSSLPGVCHADTISSSWPTKSR